MFFLHPDSKEAGTLSKIEIKTECNHLQTTQMHPLNSHVSHKMLNLTPSLAIINIIDQLSNLFKGYNNELKLFIEIQLNIYNQTL